MNYQSSSTYGLDSINVSLMRSDDGKSWKKQPLLITPRWDRSLPFLCGFLRSNRSWVDKMITEYGAILCRGFEISTGADFEEAVTAYNPDLNATYRGTSPRGLIVGTKKVFSAAEVPVYYPIAQHLEMSFLRAPPEQLYFGCLQASSKVGG